MPADDRDVIKEAVLAVMRALDGDADALKRLRRVFGRAARERQRKQKAERASWDRFLRRIRVGSDLTRWSGPAKKAKAYFNAVCWSSAGPDKEQIAVYAAKDREFRKMGKALPATHLPAALHRLRRKDCKPSDFILGAVAAKHGVSESLIEHDRANLRRLEPRLARSALRHLEVARRKPLVPSRVDAHKP